jgi:hypothetical protein
MVPTSYSEPVNEETTVFVKNRIYVKNNVGRYNKHAWILSKRKKGSGVINARCKRAVISNIPNE